METIKKWKAEGKIDVLEVDKPTVSREQPTHGWPGAPPKPVPERTGSWKGKNRPAKMKESGNANFKSIASILFPGKDPLRLNMTEINTIAHLIRHHSIKNEIFVTVNTKDLISDGRRDVLKSQFGIIIMTPEEVVKMLPVLSGWEKPKGEKKAPVVAAPVAEKPKPAKAVAAKPAKPAKVAKAAKPKK